MYLWQDSYIAVLLERDKSKLYGRILEARSALEQRFLAPIDDEELRAMGVAAVALDAIERKRPRLISNIRAGKNIRDRDLKI
jgi:hypothetical protein